MTDSGVLDGLIKYMIDQKHPEKGMKLFTALLLGSNLATDRFLETKGIESILDMMMSAIQSDNQHVVLHKCLVFLSEMCNCPKIKEIINKSEFNIRVFK